MYVNYSTNIVKLGQECILQLPMYFIGSGLDQAYDKRKNNEMLSMEEKYERSMRTTFGGG